MPKLELTGLNFGGVASRFEEMKTAEDIIIWQCNINQNDIETLIEVIFESKVLNEFYAQGCFFKHDIKVLTKAFKESTTLAELCLSRNNIGDEGAKVLAGVLKESQTLKGLYLSYNNISNEGAKVLADALKESKTLTTLDLHYNNISDEGAKALADALKESKTLKELYVWDNNIGQEGAKAFIDALLKNKSMKMENICMNGYQNSIDAVLAQVKMKRRFFSLIPSETNWRITAVGRFLRRDGDHAIGTRVFEFLFSTT